MEIEAVQEGQSIALPAVSGVGWTRQTVPVDGIVVTDGDQTVFIPEAVVRKALSDLQALKR
jgi:hypothetical protein